MLRSELSVLRCVIAIVSERGLYNGVGFFPAVDFIDAHGLGCCFHVQRVFIREKVVVQTVD